MTIEITTKPAKVRTVRPTKTAEEIEAIKAAAKAAAAEKQAALAATSWTGSTNSTFVASAQRRHHKGKYSISAKDGGYEIKPSEEGLRFFRNRLASTNTIAAVGIAVATVMKSNKDTAALGRKWSPNAGRIAGKPVALPVFAGAGDAVQQAAFAMLVSNYLAG